MSENLIKARFLIFCLAILQNQGRDNEEADEIRDELDFFWYSLLNKEEKLNLDKYSADLHRILK